MADKRSEENKNISRFVSLLIHALLLCLCVFYTITYEDPPPPPPNAVYVEFQEEVVAVASASAQSLPETQPVESNPAPPAPSNPAKSSIREETATVKAEKTKVTPKKTAIKIPEQEQKEPSQEELAAQAEKERTEKLNASKSKFGSFLSKSGEADTGANSESSTDGELELLTEGVSQIGKGLKGRKVIEKPSIRDKSQKTGKVAITICVNQQGKVINAEYTQLGSTTTDNYLVNLALRAARQYVFESSNNEQQCGDIIIHFKVK